MHPFQPELPAPAVSCFAHMGVEQIFCIQERLINVFQTGCKFLIILLRRSSNGSFLQRCPTQMSLGNVDGMKHELFSQKDL